MSILSPPEALPAAEDSISAAAHSQWSFGRLLARAIVILIGMAVGCFIGVFIGLLTGLIEIRC